MTDTFSVDASIRAVAAAGINGRKIEEAVTAAINQQSTAKKPPPKAAAAGQAA